MLNRRHLLTLGAVFGTGAGAVVLGVGALTPASPAYRDLTAPEAHARALAGEVLLIDIRRPNEWTLTGLGEGAIPLDMRRRDFTQALAEITGPDRARPVALICAAGVRSARTARKLQEAGFTNVFNVPEGMTGSGAGPGWLRRGLPRVAWERAT